MRAAERAALLSVVLLDVGAGIRSRLQLPLQTVLHAQQPPAPQSHSRLFPPIDLGLLESPDRAAWQKPEQIMDVLHVADGSKVADIGAGAGWFTIRLARRVGPNGIVYSQDVQREMLEAITKTRHPRGTAERADASGRGKRSQPAGVRTRCDRRRRCLPGSGRPRHVPQESRARTQAEWADRRRELEARTRWTWSAENVRVDKASVIADVRAAGLRIVDEETLPYQYMLALAK